MLNTALPSCCIAVQQMQMQRAQPHSWRVYFSGADFTPDDRRLLLIHDLIPYFSDDSLGWRMLAPLQRHSSGWVCNCCPGTIVT